MALYAIGDLHLSLGTNKPMDVFGPGWANHVQRLEEAFFLPGGGGRHCAVRRHLLEASTCPRAWRTSASLTACRGRKLLVKGNHDYWWTTASKMRRFFQRQRP